VVAHGQFLARAGSIPVEFVRLIFLGRIDPDEPPLLCLVVQLDFHGIAVHDSDKSCRVCGNGRERRAKDQQQEEQGREDKGGSTTTCHAEGSSGFSLPLKEWLPLTLLKPWRRRSSEGRLERYETPAK
jgi:hypothetical protein